MSRTLPPLSALPAFEATVRLGSMTRAGVEMGRTHGAVSRQIKSLEDALGVTLFERDTIPLRPTPAGAELYAATVGAFETLERATRRVAATQEPTRVTLACGSTFANRWLVPRLPRFYDEHPGISVALTMATHSSIDVADYDVATTYDRLAYDPPHEFRSVVLGDVRFSIVCRADYPHAMRDGRLVVETLFEATSRDPVRPPYRGRPEIDAVAARVMRFPHMHLCVEAALSGLGATLVERRLVEDEVASGRLIAPAGELVIADGFLAVPHPHRPFHAAARKLVAWLTQEAKREPG